MNNQLLNSGHDESHTDGHPAVGGETADREALEAFVHDAENGVYDEGDADHLAAAVETIQTLLETTASAASTPEPTPTKWADTADYSGFPNADASAAVVSHPIDRIVLPDAVDATAARAAYDAVVEFLVAAGPATDDEITGSVMPAHPLGYAPPSATDHEAAMWWQEVIKPTLDVDPTVRYRSGFGYELGG